MIKINRNDINVGDILFISGVLVKGNNIGSRPFLVWGYDSATISQIMMLEISSEPKTGSNYPYNIPILKSGQNGLNVDSHIKTDQMFIFCENVIPNNIIKFGVLEIPKYGQVIIEKRDLAILDKKYVYYDQSNSGKQLRGW